MSFDQMMWSRIESGRIKHCWTKEVCCWYPLFTVVRCFINFKGALNISLTTFSLTTFSLTTFSATTSFSLMTFSSTTFSVTTLIVVRCSINFKGARTLGLTTISVTTLEHYIKNMTLGAECCQAECRLCRVSRFIVIMQSVFMVNVVALFSSRNCSVFIVILDVIRQSVVAHNF